MWITDHCCLRHIFVQYQGRFNLSYFSTFPGKYFAGDGVKRDADGYYWITGRVDDVLNISGHRLGTAEIESALVSDGRLWFRVP
jgi:acyl-coenzyme A synthetase/AMP-(fatty) acid ligase